MSRVEYPGKIGEYLQKSNSYFIAALTDEYIIDKADNFAKYGFDTKKDKVLEIRVFNTGAEYKLFRSTVGKDFYERILDDTTGSDHYDEIQYLDVNGSIDKKDGKVHSTGGCIYNLPIEKTNSAKVRIRYYLDQYSSTGQVRIKDWRVVGFEEG